MPGAAASSAHVCPEILQTEGLAWQSLTVSCCSQVPVVLGFDRTRERRREGQQGRNSACYFLFFFFFQSFDEFIVPKV